MLCSLCLCALIFVRHSRTWTGVKMAHDADTRTWASFHRSQRSETTPCCCRKQSITTGTHVDAYARKLGPMLWGRSCMSQPASTTHTIRQVCFVGTANVPLATRTPVWPQQVAHTQAIMRRGLSHRSPVGVASDDASSRHTTRLFTHGCPPAIEPSFTYLHDREMQAGGSNRWRR